MFAGWRSHGNNLFVLLCPGSPPCHVSLSFSCVWFCGINWSTPRSYIANMSDRPGRSGNYVVRINLTTHEGTSNCFFQRYINLNLKWPWNIGTLFWRVNLNWPRSCRSKNACASNCINGGPSVWYKVDHTRNFVPLHPENENREIPTIYLRNTG